MHPPCPAPSLRRISAIPQALFRHGTCHQVRTRALLPCSPSPAPGDRNARCPAQGRRLGTSCLVPRTVPLGLCEHPQLPQPPLSPPVSSQWWCEHPRADSGAGPLLFLLEPRPRDHQLVPQHPTSAHTPLSLLPTATMPPALLATCPCHRARVGGCHEPSPAPEQGTGAAPGIVKQRKTHCSSYGAGGDNRAQQPPAAGSTSGSAGHSAPHRGEGAAGRGCPTRTWRRWAGAAGATGGSYQGMRRPKRVHGVLLMKKPTKGSVMASQARPTNRMMEA